MKFLLLSGSFHTRSRSLAILKSIEVYFGSHSTQIPKLDSIPFYCDDLTNSKPDVVQALLSQIELASGILFCTPEYNHSIPAVLKNAIDWASRPAFNSPLKNKPVSIITQAVSPVGGARAQAHLKLVLDSTLSEIHMCHEMMIAGIDKAFDPSMQIIDSDVLLRLERHIRDFILFTKKRSRAK